MDVTSALLDSWDRQCRILTSVAGLVDDATRKAMPSVDGWPLDKHLAHIHLVRKFWLARVSPERAEALPDTFVDGWETPIDDLAAIKAALDASGPAIGETVKELFANGTQAIGGYDHPVFFLQHMIWHEGWHVGLLFLGLRGAGKEPPEEWEYPHVWGQWVVED